MLPFVLLTPVPQIKQFLLPKVRVIVEIEFSIDTVHYKKENKTTTHTKNEKWLEWLRGNVQWIQRNNSQCPPASSANGLISTCQYLNDIFHFDHWSFSIFTTSWSLFFFIQFYKIDPELPSKKIRDLFVRHTVVASFLINISEKKRKNEYEESFVVMWNASFLTKPVMKNSYHKVWPSCQLLDRTSLQSPLPGRT